MAKSNFVNLRVYQLAEELSDAIWDIVTGWDYFAKGTVGKEMKENQIVNFVVNQN